MITKKSVKQFYQLSYCPKISRSILFCFDWPPVKVRQSLESFPKSLRISWSSCVYVSRIKLYDITKDTGLSWEMFGPYVGIVICATSSLFFCVCNVIVKHLENVDPLLISGYRFFAIAMFSMPFSSKRVNNLTSFPTWKLLIIRSIFGATNQMIYYFAIQVWDFNFHLEIISIWFNSICLWLIVSWSVQQLPFSLYFLPKSLSKKK